MGPRFVLRERSRTPLLRRREKKTKTMPPPPPPPRDVPWAQERLNGMDEIDRLIYQSLTRTFPGAEALVLAAVQLNRPPSEALLAVSTLASLGGLCQVIS